ncbi:MAG: Y-family DNA polymerase [Kangiellaceae bacterium]|nr:Y-family DNA polymerase [Kangiellaceae bacterium]
MNSPSEKAKIYALCDVNNFYVSCERLFRPDLQNKPVIVLSNNDGCIISISDEAKAAGIKMAIPYHEAKEIIEQHKITTFSSNYGLYGDISQRFNWVLEQYCDQVSAYSVDESFLMFEGYESNLYERAINIRKELLRTLSLPTCIGLAPTKTLAKVANHYAKRHKTSTQGVVDLCSPQQRQWILKQIPIQNVWGIGRQLSKKLMTYRIHTAWDLHNADYKTLQRLFSVNMERTILELRGQPCLSFNQLAQPKKSILNSRSFAKRITEYSDLREALSYHATRCCEKLRKQGSLASSISMFLYARKHNKDYLYRPNLTITLPEATDDTSIFLQAIDKGLKQIYLSGEHYKKAGVMLNGIVTREGYQSDFFNHIQQRPELMQKLDLINQRFGKDSVKFASLGFSKNWAMRANHYSGNYVGSWHDILRLK